MPPRGRCTSSGPPGSVLSRGGKDSRFGFVPAVEYGFHRSGPSCAVWLGTRVVRGRCHVLGAGRSRAAGWRVKASSSTVGGGKDVHHASPPAQQPTQIGPAGAVPAVASPGESCLRSPPCRSRALAGTGHGLGGHGGSSRRAPASRADGGGSPARILLGQDRPRAVPGSRGGRWGGDAGRWRSLS